MTRRGDFKPLRHGTYSGYKAHSHYAIPFPQDIGGESCGCREANVQAARDYRARYGIRRVRCAWCGERRAVRPDREGQCGKCWRATVEERAKAEKQAREKLLESQKQLIYGRWVKGLDNIWRWRPYEYKGAA